MIKQRMMKLVLNNETTLLNTLTLVLHEFLRQTINQSTEEANNDNMQSSPNTVTVTNYEKRQRINDIKSKLQESYEFAGDAIFNMPFLVGTTNNLLHKDCRL